MVSPSLVSVTLRSHHPVLCAAIALSAFTWTLHEPTAAEAAMTPSITVTPSSGVSGTRVRIRGSGFDADAPAKIYFNTTVADTFTTSATGTFDRTVAMPAAMTGTISIRATAEVSALGAFTITVPQLKPAIGSWRGVYTPHGWVGAVKSDAFITTNVNALVAQRFNHQIINAASLDFAGLIPASQHPGLARWMLIARQVAPTMRTVLWVSGNETLHVNNVALHPTIVASLAALLTTSGAEGLLVDLEPFTGSNANLLKLLTTLRAAAPNAWIATTAPPGTKWTNAFIAQVAAVVDAISVMHYDTEAASAAVYIARFRTDYDRFATAAGTAADVIPSIPAFAANAWHNPLVENVATAVAAIGSASAPRVGAALYWWYEADATALAAWVAGTTVLV